MFRYTVRCIFIRDDQDLANDWLRWMQEKHIDDVVDAGAESAEIVRMDARPITIEIRYSFRDRAAFEDYESNHAPRLRADGIATFPLERGLKYERATGEVIS